MTLSVMRKTTEENLLQKELRILEEYQQGKIIEPNDSQILEDLCVVGFLRRGISLKEKKPTAITTTSGLSFLKGMKKVK
ncbi:hypothetical protein [uncultured Methanospirillum sp.]|uniref:hypothetical protein n=1 Tax=uncultured Methanospirillum sp. TaxID=262503 RepID=UPI0029C8587B|nr:hypothetical protein [uncultured Methanospirillum sp.]